MHVHKSISFVHPFFIFIQLLRTRHHIQFIFSSINTRNEDFCLVRGHFSKSPDLDDVTIVILGYSSPLYPEIFMTFLSCRSSWRQSYMHVFMLSIIQWCRFYIYYTCRSRPLSKIGYYSITFVSFLWIAEALKLDSKRWTAITAFVHRQYKILNKIINNICLHFLSWTLHPVI